MNGLSSKGEWSEELEKEFGPNTFEKISILISPNKINKNYYISCFYYHLKM